jgi:nucleotide-binding universal stress UspA family protein
VSGPPGGRGRIVVGIDGSTGSDAALDYACDEATQRTLSVAAVTAWEPPNLWITPEGLVPPAATLQAMALDAARRQVARVAAARAARGLPAVDVSVEAHSGPAGAVLERIARHAEMLIVGHRGRGAVASRLIGSVGLSCVVHAPCTVVVVRSSTESP